MNFIALGFFLKKYFLYFRSKLTKPRKQNISYVSLKKFSLHFWMTADEAVKRKVNYKKSSFLSILCLL